MSGDDDDDDDDDRRSSHSSRLVAANNIIIEALDEDPMHVVHLLAEVVKRCKAEARYTAKEIEAAAAELRREFDMPQLGMPHKGH